MDFLKRTSLIARFTLLEAVRERSLYVVGLAGIGLVFVVQGLRQLDFGGSQERFVTDLSLGSVELCGSILSVLFASQLFLRDIESRTALTLLAKPVARSEFIAGKFFGTFAVLGLFAAAAAALLALMIPSERMIIGAALLALEFSLIAAGTILVATYARSLFLAVSVGLSATVICHLHPVLDAVATGENATALHFVAKAIAISLPNFRVFSPDGLTGLTGADAIVRGVSIVGYAAAYVVLYGMLAVISFRRREL